MVEGEVPAVHIREDTIDIPGLAHETYRSENASYSRNSQVEDLELRRSDVKGPGS